MLKWAAPQNLGMPFAIRPGRNGALREFDQVEIVLCFGREAQGDKASHWSDSDFNKTVAYCNYLSKLLNQRLDAGSLRFSVVSSTDRVTDWTEFGRDAGTEFALRRINGDLSNFTGDMSV